MSDQICHDCQNGIHGWCAGCGCTDPHHEEDYDGQDDIHSQWMEPGEAGLYEGVEW